MCVRASYMKLTTDTNLHQVGISRNFHIFVCLCLPHSIVCYYFSLFCFILCDDFNFVPSYSIELFHQPTLMHNFIYSLTICLLHYYLRHVSSINMPIFRRKNCMHTASVIFALSKRLHSTLVESELRWLMK